ALEAMVAMAAAIAAVYPHMNHIGGDGFFLMREPSGRIRAIMGGGPAGAGARIELYGGHETIPPRGPLAALTVPGAVGTWMLALAATLDHLAHAGLDDFYRGDVAREMAADLAAIGSPVGRADLAAYRAVVDEPLSVAVRSGTLFNTPPPTQGIASLILLALFDRLRVEQAESFDHIHGLVEATKRAFLVRDRYVTDPVRLSHPPERYLAEEFLDAEARHIDRKAAPWPASAQRRDAV